MAFNPPETRDELRDTMYLCGVPADEYKKIHERGQHVFVLRNSASDVEVKIYNPWNVRINGRKYPTVTEAKISLMKSYLKP